MKFIYIFTIRIVYDSGYTHDFECTEFEIDKSGNLSWTAVDLKNRPLIIARDLNKITAIWQFGHRRKLVWEKRTK